MDYSTYPIYSCHPKWPALGTPFVSLFYLFKFISFSLFTYFFFVMAFLFSICLTSWVAQMVKNLLAMQETWVQSLGQEDPLEEGMATHSSILAWRSPWTEEPGGLQSKGSHRVRHDWVTNTTTQQQYTL